MQKAIYSLPALRELLEAANRRYLEFLSAIEDPRAGRNKLDKLSQPVEQEGRRYSGFNLFDQNDEICCAPSFAASSISAVCRTNPSPPSVPTHQQPGLKATQTITDSWAYQKGRP